MIQIKAPDLGGINNTVKLCSTAMKTEPFLSLGL